LLEQVVRIDKRVLDVDMERQQVTSLDQRRLEVDAYARFRVIDPIKMYQTAGTVDKVAEQLQPILNSVLRQELGKRTFASLLTPERGQAMARIREGLDREAREYGAQVIDVRIKRADLPDGTPLESAFARMATARAQEAATIPRKGKRTRRSFVPRPKRKRRGSMPRALARILISMTFTAPCRAMTIPSPKNSNTIILSPDNRYLKRFKGE
jgi:membrane protease subunit HflC